MTLIALLRKSLTCVRPPSRAQETTFAQNLEQTSPILRPTYLLIVLADAIVAGAMCFILQGNRTEYARWAQAHIPYQHKLSFV
jgi:hypothetical protein